MPAARSTHASANSSSAGVNAIMMRRCARGGHGLLSPAGPRISMTDEDGSCAGLGDRAE